MVSPIASGCQFHFRHITSARKMPVPSITPLTAMP